MNYPIIKVTRLLQVPLPSVLTDGLQVVSLFGFSHISLNIESVLKMGLKSNEREHLLIRQLKQTANEPTTKYALFMTDSLCPDRLKYFYVRVRSLTVICHLSTEKDFLLFLISVS